VGASSFAGGSLVSRTAGVGSSIVKYDVARTATGSDPLPGTGEAAVMISDIARTDAGSDPTPSLTTGAAEAIVAIRTVSGAGFFNNGTRTLNPTTIATVVISPARVSISIEGIWFSSHTRTGIAASVQAPRRVTHRPTRLRVLPRGRHPLELAPN